MPGWTNAKRTVGGHAPGLTVPARELPAVASAPAITPEPTTNPSGWAPCWPPCTRGSARCHCLLHPLRPTLASNSALTPTPELWHRMLVGNFRDLHHACTTNEGWLRAQWVGKV
jgi:hypothetical protein